MYKLKGSIVALVTPMESDGSIAWQSLFDLIDWHVESGTSGLVLVGTTGESATIDVAEHVQIIEQSSKHAKERIPIIAGTGANSTKEAIYLTSAAKKAGADAATLSHSLLQQADSIRIDSPLLRNCQRSRNTTNSLQCAF